MDVAKYEGHTPGPWRKLPEEVDKPYIRIRGTMLGGRYKVANVLTPVYEGVPEREAKETRANAALIEDAPLLLAEVDRLQKLADAISRHCNDCANQRNKAQSELATERARYAELVAAAKAATDEVTHDGASSRAACDRLIQALAALGPQS